MFVKNLNDNHWITPTPPQTEAVSLISVLWHARAVCEGNGS